MEIRFRDISADKISADLLVLPVHEKKLDEPALRALDRGLRGKLAERLQKSKFIGTEGSSLLLPTLGLLPAGQLLVIGIGGQETDNDSWRRLGARARKEAAHLGAVNVALFF